MNRSARAGIFYKRAFNILLRPRREWDLILNEKPSMPGLVLGYLLILSLIPLSTAFIGYWIVGKSLEVFWFRDFNYALAMGLLCFASSIAAPLIAAAIIKSVYPLLKNPDVSGRVVQLTVYAMTPVILAGVFHLVPYFRFLVYAGGIYGIVIIWFGSVKLINYTKENHLTFFLACTGIVYGIYYAIYMVIKIILDAVFLPSLKEFIERLH